jgi:hypothetical protein
MIVANNVFAFNESGGLKFGSNEAATYDTVTGNVIVNNIFYKNGWKGNREVSMGHVNGVQLMVENYGASATKLGPHIIRNNLFLSDVPQHAYFDNRYSFPYYAKPAAHLNTNLSRERSWLVSGNLETDPLFTDAEGGDFSLQKGSPALRAGLDLSYYGLPEKFTNGSVWPSSIAKGQRLLWSIGANVENIIQPVAKQFSIRRKVRKSG